MLDEEDLLEVDVLSDSEGFNDSYCRPATPMLLCYMRETGTVFSEVYREDAPGSISSKDCFSLTEDMFVGAGGFVINKCFKVQSMLEFRHAATQSASSSVSVAASSEGQLVAWKPFMPRARALSVFDLSAVPASTSSKSQQDLKLLEAASKLVSLMPMEVREAFKPGYSSLGEEERAPLLLLSVKNLAGAKTLGNAANLLVDLDRWLTARFSIRHGFYAQEAVVELYFSQRLVADGGEGHVSRSALSSAIFCQEKLKFPISASSLSVRSFSKAPSKAPKQAPSIGVRFSFGLWRIASDVSLSAGMRAVAGLFEIKLLAALRGVDSQRSSFDGRHSLSADYDFISSIAWDSKRKEPMPWAVPLSIFGGGPCWAEPALGLWGSRDYMFPTLPRGLALADAGISSFLDVPATPYTVLKYLRELAVFPHIGMSAEEAARARRHSFRHYLANVLQMGKFSYEDKFRGGRWRDLSVMPLRYAQETKFLAAVELVCRAMDFVAAAVVRVPISKWPFYGGWELLMPTRGPVPDLAAFALPDPDEEGDSDDETVVVEEADASVFVPPPGKDLPPGWSVLIKVLSSGTNVPYFYGPQGEKERSRVGAWRAWHAAGGREAGVEAGAAGSSVLERPVLGSSAEGEQASSLAAQSEAVQQPPEVGSWISVFTLDEALPDGCGDVPCQIVSLGSCPWDGREVTVFSLNTSSERVFSLEGEVWSRRAPPSPEDESFWAAFRVRTQRSLWGLHPPLPEGSKRQRVSSSSR